MWIIIVIVGFMFGAFAFSNIIGPLFFAWPRLKKAKKTGKLAKSYSMFTLVSAPIFWSALVVGSCWIVGNFMNEYLNLYLIVLGLDLLIMFFVLLKKDQDWESDFKSSYGKYEVENNDIFLMQKIDQMFGSKLNWKVIEEIPNFPMNNYGEVISEISNNKFSFALSPNIANDFAQGFYSKGYALFNTFLASALVFVTIISITMAIVLRNYWLLLGVVIGFLGQLLAIPNAPFKSIVKPFIGILFFAFVYGLWQGQETMTYLSAFFICPFLMVTYLYDLNQARLSTLFMKSQTLFIYLYQSGYLGIKDVISGQTFWNHVKNN
jgi:hypothetical protein